MPETLEKKRVETDIQKRLANRKDTPGKEPIDWIPPELVSKKLDLLLEVGREIENVTDINELIKHIVKTTQYATKASASSVLLTGPQDQDLYFKIAEGKVGKVLRQKALASQSGIARWVAQHAKPLVVNDAYQDWRFDRKIDDTTGFTTRSIMCVPLIVHRRILGVIEVLNKRDGSDFSEQDLETLQSVASTAAIAIENTRLQQSILENYKSTIAALAEAIDAKDPYTCGHSHRVTEYTLLAGSALSFSKKDLEVLEYGATLHDIGKIGIAESILVKPGRLTDEEYRIIQNHPAIGANIIKDILFLKEARELVLHHHEKHDGSGYPDGLRGEEIPIGARLLSVADAFDTITTNRPYRAASNIEQALKEIRRCSGSQFCPRAVNAFVLASIRWPQAFAHINSRPR